MNIEIDNVKAKVLIKENTPFVVSFKVSIAGVVFNQDDFVLCTKASQKLYKKIEAKASKKGSRDRN